MDKEKCRDCVANDPEAKICKHCKHFGVLNSDGLEMDWCFDPKTGGATATLYSCEHFKKK